MPCSPGQELAAGIRNIPSAELQLQHQPVGLAQIGESEINFVFELALGLSAQLMKLDEEKTFIVPPEKGYTDPSHFLYGINTIYTVIIQSIVENVRPDYVITITKNETIPKQETITKSDTSGSDSVSSLPMNLFPMLLGMLSTGVLVMYKRPIDI